MMYVRLAAVLVLALSALLAGCGGGGSGSSSPAATFSYPGGYAGSFTATTNSVAQTGTNSFTIDQYGDVSGSFVNTTTSQTGTVVGTATSVPNTNTINLAVSVTYTAPTSTNTVDEIGLQGNETLNGTSITGTLTEYDNHIVDGVLTSSTQIGTLTFNNTFTAAS